MKTRSTFTTWEVGNNGVGFNTVIERRSNWEVISKYNAKGALIEAVDDNGERYVIIPLEGGETATYNLKEFQVRTLMFCNIM